MPVSPTSEKTNPTGTDQPLSSDGSLLRRFRAGEQDAATELYLRYAQRLLHLAQSKTPSDLAQRVPPEDIVQSVFRTFFRRAADGNYETPQGEDLWKLLLVISLNKIRSQGSFHRAARRDVGQTRSLEPDQAGSAQREDESALRVLELTIEDLLATMPEAHRPMILLRIEGHDVRTISDRTRRSKRSVERVLQTFRERLANVIYANDPELKSGPIDDSTTG